MTSATPPIPTSPFARVHEIVEEVIGDTDVFLVEVVVRGQKGSRVVEVYVDSEDGVGVDSLAKLSREIGFLIETEDVIKGRYNLNVSSPGTDRPLLFIRQYPKHVGRTLSVKYSADEEDANSKPKKIKGELLAVDGETIILKTASDPEFHLPFEAIEHANVVLPW